MATCTIQGKRKFTPFPSRLGLQLRLRSTVTTDHTADEYKGACCCLLVSFILYENGVQVATPILDKACAITIQGVLDEVDNDGPTTKYDVLRTVSWNAPHGSSKTKRKEGKIHQSTIFSFFLLLSRRIGPTSPSHKILIHPSPPMAVKNTRTIYPRYGEFCMDPVLRTILYKDTIPVMDPQYGWIPL